MSSLDGRIICLRSTELSPLAMSLAFPSVCNHGRSQRTDNITEHIFVSTAGWLRLLTLDRVLQINEVNLARRSNEQRRRRSN